MIVGEDDVFLSAGEVGYGAVCGSGQRRVLIWRVSLSRAVFCGNRRWR